MKILDVVGLILLVAAASLAWLPLGFAVAGAGCLWLSWAATR